VSGNPSLPIALFLAILRTVYDNSSREIGLSSDDGGLVMN